jgi:hypothetical protein
MEYGICRRRGEERYLWCVAGNVRCAWCVVVGVVVGVVVCVLCVFVCDGVLCAFLLSMGE